MKRSSMRTLRFAILTLCLPTAAFAQRDLHWDRLQVTAHVEAEGYLRVVETQTMVFTGDWNGGERKFNIRPRQRLSFTGISRGDGTAWQPLTQDADLDSVDDYTWADRYTLRWRSRLRSDPPFNNTTLRYELRYVLSGILLKEGDRYRLNHDFAFPDRAGTIDRFDLALTFDPAWQPMTNVRQLYAASGLAPGQSFILNIPLRYTGAGTPSILDLSRPRGIQIAVLVLIGATLLSAVWFFVREQSHGRFAPLEDVQVNEPWLRAHVLQHPAEVVGAAWDDKIGTAEVVALLARMTSDGKLESDVSGGGKSSSMTLHLKADRSTLKGYERKLVDALFYGARTKTTTEEVQAHYRSKGFNPVSVIEKDLKATVQSAFPFDEVPPTFRVNSLAVFLAGVALLLLAWFLGSLSGFLLVVLGFGSWILAGVAAIPGLIFRRRMDWGRGVALLCLIPAFAIAAAVASFLWFYAGTGLLDLEPITLMTIVGLALGVTNSSMNSLRSRLSREGIDARKKLAAGRHFFLSELRKPRPALRDEWYPWVLAFGLGKQVDHWSAERASAHSTGGSFIGSSSSSQISSSSSDTWTGFGGGRSGGGGGGASWAAAATGMAAGVSAPSSSGGGGGSSGGGGGGGGGSSGGGGGGGW